MNLLTALKLVLELIPLIINAMKIIEKEAPVAGQGVAKMQLLKEQLSTVTDIATDVDKKSYDSAFEKAVSFAAGIMKIAGVFNK